MSAAKDISAFSEITSVLKQYPDIYWQAVSLGDVKTVTKNAGAFERAAKECSFKHTDITQFATRNIKDILRLLSPDILVLCNEDPFIERAFVLSAAHLNIPAVLLQNGNWANIDDLKFSVSKAFSRVKLFRNVLNSYLFYFVTSVDLFNNPWKTIRGSLSFAFLLRNRKKGLDCAYSAVTGYADKKLLLSEGVASYRVIVTGNPALDTIITKQPDKIEVCRKIGLDPSKPIALFLTTAAVEHQLWTEKMNEEFTNTVIGALWKIENLQIIIKVHPVEKMSTYSKYRNSRTVAVHEGLDDMIKISDVVITYHSTAALSAILLYKSLIDLNFFNEREIVPYVSSGVALPARTGEEVTKAVDQLLHDDQILKQLNKAQQKFLIEFANNADGLASKRFVELLMRINEARASSSVR